MQPNTTQSRKRRVPIVVGSAVCIVALVVGGIMAVQPYSAPASQAVPHGQGQSPATAAGSRPTAIASGQIDSPPADAAVGSSHSTSDPSTATSKGAGVPAPRSVAQPKSAAPHPTLDDLSAAFERDMQRVREQRTAAADTVQPGAEPDAAKATEDSKTKASHPPQVLPGNPFRRPAPPGRRPHQTGPVNGENAAPVGGPG